MKTFLILLLTAAGVHGANIRFATTNTFGLPDTNYIVLRPIGDPAMANGALISRGLPFRILPDADGIVVTNLSAGHYAASNSVLVAQWLPTVGTREGVIFAVPDDSTTNVYNIGPDIVISGANVFNYTPGVRRLIGTNGIVVTPTTGVGELTIDGADFTPEFSDITNSLGFTPLTAQEVTNATAVVTNTIVGAAIVGPSPVTNGLATIAYADARANAVTNTIVGAAIVGPSPLTNGLATTSSLNTASNAIVAQIVSGGSGGTSTNFVTNWVAFSTNAVFTNLNTKINVASNALQVAIDGKQASLGFNPQFGAANLTNWSQVTTGTVVRSMTGRGTNVTLVNVTNRGRVWFNSTDYIEENGTFVLNNGDITGGGGEFAAPIISTPDGSGIALLNASALASGTVALARLPFIPQLASANLTNWSLIATGSMATTLLVTNVARETTNGLATQTYVNTATNGFTTTTYVDTATNTFKPIIVYHSSGLQVVRGTNTGLYNTLTETKVYDWDTGQFKDAMDADSLNVEDRTFQDIAGLTVGGWDANGIYGRLNLTNGRMGSATVFQRDTNIAVVVGSGNVTNDGTYQWTSASGVYSNAQNQNIIVGLAQIRTPNGVTHYSGAVDSDNWITVNGASPPPQVWFGGYMIAGPMAIQGWIVSTNLDARFSSNTNGLATQTYVTGQGYVTATVTNGLATTSSLNTSSNALLAQIVSGSPSNAIPTLNGVGTNTVLHQPTLYNSGLNQIFVFQNLVGGTNNTLSGSSASSGSLLLGANNTLGFGTVAGVVGGGTSHTVGNANNYLVVAGGAGHVVGNAGTANTISGGRSNVLSQFPTSGTDQTIAGGRQNVIGGTAQYGATISGGSSNQINGGAYTIIAGGFQNTNTNSKFSFLAGRKGNVGHDSVFMWTDDQGTIFTSAKTNTVIFRAANGMGVNTNDPGTNALRVHGNIDSAVGFSVNGVPLPSPGGAILSSSGSGTNTTLHEVTTIVNGQVTLIGSDGVTEIGAYDTLEAANAASSWGDTIVVRGTLAVSNSVPLLGVTLDMRGATILDWNTTNQVLIVPNHSTVLGGVISNMLPSASAIRAPIGSSVNDSAITNFLIDGVTTYGDADGFFLNHTNPCNGTVRNSRFVGKWDSGYLDYPGTVEFFNCKFVVEGGSSEHPNNAQDARRGMVVLQKGTNIFAGCLFRVVGNNTNSAATAFTTTTGGTTNTLVGCVFEVLGHTNIASGLNISGTTSQINLNGCSIISTYTNAIGATVLTGGKLRLDNCQVLPGMTNLQISVAGTLSAVEILGGNITQSRIGGTLPTRAYYGEADIGLPDGRVWNIWATNLFGQSMQVTNRTTGVGYYFPTNAPNSGVSNILVVVGDNQLLFAEQTQGGGGGSGDVVGPAAATDGAIALYDTTTGKLLKDSETTLESLTNHIATVSTAAATAVTNSGTANLDILGNAATATSANDPDAIHDNVSGEIDAITEKTAPVAADLVLIEDSEASFAKKKVTLDNMIAAFTQPSSNYWNLRSENIVPVSELTNYCFDLSISNATGFANVQLLRATNNVHFAYVTNHWPDAALTMTLLADGADRTVRLPTNQFWYPHFNTNGYVLDNTHYEITLTNGSKMAVSLSTNALGWTTSARILDYQ